MTDSEYDRGGIFFDDRWYAYGPDGAVSKARKYDKGGFLPPGPSVVRNNTGQPISMMASAPLPGGSYYSGGWQPGSFFLTTIDGWTGRWVAAAQAFVRGGSKYTHAGLILDRGQILEALPGGARISQVEKLYEYQEAGKPLLVSDAPVQQWMLSKGYNLSNAIGAENQKRAEVVTKARALEGTPYSFLDYAALAMAEWKLPGWQLVRARVESSQHLICSALVDRAYCWADIHLFDDGRLPGDVTPGDLADWAYCWADIHLFDDGRDVT